MQSAPAGVRATAAARRVLSDDDERAILGAQIASLEEAGLVYADSCRIVLSRSAGQRGR